MDRVDSVRWRKSSYSGSNGGGCVEVAALADDRFAVRDSALVFTHDEWRAFTAGVRGGEFDLG